MIKYDAGDWGVLFALRWEGSVLPKALVWSLSCCILSVGFHLLLEELNWFDEHPQGAGNLATNVLNGFTFILGFLIVFRSQQAYSRWWEGATLLWQLRGEWFNCVSSCIAFCSTKPEMAPEVQRFMHMLVRLVSTLHGVSLCQARGGSTNLNYLDLEGFNKESLHFLSKCDGNKCEVIMQWLQRLILDAHRKGVLDVAPPILTRVYNQMGNGMVVLQMIQKISNTPMPFAFAQMVPGMLVVHWGVMIFVLATSPETTAWVAFISFAVPIAFWSIYYIGMELEHPFGGDPNDLPIHDMQAELNCSLLQLLQDRCVHPPTFEWNQETEVKSHDVVFEDYLTHPLNVHGLESVKAEASDDKEKPLLLTPEAEDGGQAPQAPPSSDEKENKASDAPPAPVDTIQVAASAKKEKKGSVVKAPSDDTNGAQAEAGKSKDPTKEKRKSKADGKAVAKEASSKKKEASDIAKELTEGAEKGTS